MTVVNDLCDFCGNFCDPIGCDTKQRIGNDMTMWCGQCDAGLIFRFRAKSDAGLVALEDQCQRYLEDSGITWQSKNVLAKEWLAWLDHSDTLAYVKREQTRRTKVMENFAGMLHDGKSFWSE